MVSEAVLNLVYLLAAVLFVMLFKLLSKPKTSVLGNLLGSIGMLIAVVATLLYYNILKADVALAGIAVGGLIGAIMAYRTPMIAMPQMVGLLNGFGGGASLLVGGLSLYQAIYYHTPMDARFLISVAAAGIIGGITFSGSLIAFAKLQWKRVSGAVVYPGMQLVKLALLAIAVALGAWLYMNPYNMNLYWLVVAVSLALGIALTISIGGADMPVVISLLNSYSGLAAASTGFVLSNTMLIIAGSLVGTSGLILTNLMCKAMNRSFLNVLAGGFGAEVSKEEGFYSGRIKRATAEDGKIFFIICPLMLISCNYSIINLKILY
jgi:NAD(P) transhydrogenase subunit beta